MIDILTNVGALLFGFWVLFPLPAIENLLVSRRKWGVRMRLMPRNLLVGWSIFAIFRLPLFVWPARIWDLFVPEPLGTWLFFAAGSACLLWWLLVQQGGGVQAARRATTYSKRVARVAPAPVHFAHSAPAHSAPAAHSAPTCRKCGVPMVLKTAKRGQHQGERFYGCPNFPKCREMLPL